MTNPLFGWANTLRPGRELGDLYKNIAKNSLMFIHFAYCFFLKMCYNNNCQREGELTIKSPKSKSETAGETAYEFAVVP